MAMNTNQLPYYDTSDNPTGCCPRFNAEGWDGAELHFENKLFLKAETASVFHMPLNMGRVFMRAMDDMQKVDAFDEHQFIVLSRDPSSWKGEHLFSITNDVPGRDTVALSGDFVTRVFEGPYRNLPQWEEEMRDDLNAKGRTPRKIYFFYTTCPRCAKEYGKNYIVGVAEVEPEAVLVH